MNAHCSRWCNLTGIALYGVWVGISSAEDTTKQDGPSLIAPEAIAFQPYSDWIAPGDRRTNPAFAVGFTNQANRQGTLQTLFDRPTALVFFYTRCKNSAKCSAAVQTMAHLQTALTQAGLADRVNLVMISYEPSFDTPEQLKAYGAVRGIDFEKNAHMLCLDPEKHRQVVDALEVPVSYNSGWVNVHGVAMYLLDAQGRLARHYHTLMWDNERALGDLKKLLAETKDATQLARSVGQ